ncbi:TPR repeat containing exported protein; Putative periplasmic protein contains a protein prenylyltransferase domain [hydrothermal vent metagenome]|uniref:TPR repeat containing exported protein Putative periplasmic protein contains a protein prenylyltransferase domain n=1 Tax=hydrothermal vent metagenome TaxID=652676 RepID=A0A3B0X4M8_9ZZZZ
MRLKSVKLFFKPLSTAVLLMVVSSSLQAEKGLSVEQRLGRLENLMSSQVLMEQSQRLEQIQQELSSLRGLLEAQEHQLGLIKQRQRNLYQDMDRRLNDLEIQGGGASAGTPPSGMAPPGSGAGTTTGLSSPVPPPGGSLAAATMAGAGTAVSDGDKNGKSAYSSAFNMLKEGRYPQAIKSFKAFLQNYPESIYGSNAQYWLGEAYSVSREYKMALAAFEKVISQYPESSKVEGSMLKIGFTYFEMKNWASARSALDNVIRKFSGTTVSRKAKERLQRMKREGH